MRIKYSLHLLQINSVNFPPFTGISILSIKMSSLKRKCKVGTGKNAKMKLTCDSFHEEFLNKFEKFRTTDDRKVQKIFEEHAIRNTDKKTLQH